MEVPILIRLKCICKISYKKRKMLVMITTFLKQIGQYKTKLYREISKRPGDAYLINKVRKLFTKRAAISNKAYHAGSELFRSQNKPYRSQSEQSTFQGLQLSICFLNIPAKQSQSYSQFMPITKSKSCRGLCENRIRSRP